MLTRLRGALVLVLAGLAPNFLGAQALTPVGVTRNAVTPAREVTAVVGHEAFEESHGARSRAPFIIVGAIVGGIVGAAQYDRATASCDGCAFAGLVVVEGAAAGALAGWFIHDALFDSARPLPR